MDTSNFDDEDEFEISEEFFIVSNEEQKYSNENVTIKKPNLFFIATKELSQDGFITWLIKWADESFASEDEKLNSLGKKFLLSLLSKEIDTSNICIKKVKAGRQLEHIDIWADIDEKYFIIIEDKTNSNEHGNQLKTYEEIIENKFGKSRKIIKIYLKTGLESRMTVKKIENKGWHYFSRKEFLNVLENNQTNNAIINDYYGYINDLETESQSFYLYSKLTNWEATKGLYLWLQEKLPAEDNCDWGYRANPKGGFLGLWCHTVSCKNNPSIKFYLQIENYCKLEDNKPKIDLCVKVAGDWNKKMNYLYGGLKNLKNIASKYEMIVTKPKKYKIGKHCTSVAIINDIFVEKNGELNLDNLIKKIMQSRCLVNDLVDML